MRKLFIAAAGVVFAVTVWNEVLRPSTDRSPEVGSLRMEVKKDFSYPSSGDGKKVEVDPVTVQSRQSDGQRLQGLQASLHDYSEFRKFDFAGFFENYQWTVGNVVRLLKILNDHKAAAGGTTKPNVFDPVDLAAADPEGSCVALRNSKVPVSVKIGLLGEVLDTHYDTEYAAEVDPEIRNCVFTPRQWQSQAMEYVVVWNP
ncbi:MAG TPA: hypothetical protein VNJ01_14265 [Bacteriovoracaceae bacterium]|nr:hypothetical protein [Bacteriovoracaceae bacterium]